MNKKFIIFLLMYASVANTGQLQVLAVPGMNGVGAKPDYIQKILGQNARVHEVPTPGITLPKSITRHVPLSSGPGFITADLGGSLCMRHINKAYKNINGPMIGFGASQGSAGITKLAAHPTTRLQAVIVEAVLASPSNAILHNAANMGFESLTKYAIARYALPYFAKFMFPFYWPFTQQPIQALHNIPKHIPIIIIHAQNDPETPYEDACAFYREACLQRLTEKNVYFIRVPDFGHVNLMEDDSSHDIKNREAIQRILKKHNVLPTASIEVGDLREYQPSYEEAAIVEHHRKLMAQVRNHNYIGYTLKSVTAAALIRYVLKTGMDMVQQITFLSGASV